MSEQKPERDAVDDARTFLACALVRSLVGQRRLVEFGWECYRRRFMPPECGVDRINETRLAFLAGAQHLFGSLFVAYEFHGDEPTPDDEAVLTGMQAEMQRVMRELERADAAQRAAKAARAARG